MLTRTKYFALGFIVAGIPVFMINHMQPGSELLIMTGLFLLFFSKEKVEDERAGKLRTEALMVSFAVGYLLELLLAYLHNKEVTGFDLQHTPYFIMFVLVLAIIIFYTRTFFTGFNERA
ncbi:hypothetical protein [Chitinophaga sp. MM2321]|uniref:hypothetical protein n=1 Tax=Chitinophaga sp. MM2321 TaxID=3137178 RepID=UPI0032D574A6